MKTLVMAVLVLMTGCSDERRGTGLDAGPQLDAGLALVDARSQDASLQPDAGPSCAGPTSGFGTQLGTAVAPLTLSRCDGTPFSVYGAADGFCDAGATVLVVVAGWCAPCRMLASELQSMIVSVYGPRGARVVQVLLAKDDYTAPDAAFCAGWTSQYGLTCPVVMDPEMQTAIYGPMDAVPVVVVFDNQGIIRHREIGISSDLSMLAAALDALLP